MSSFLFLKYQDCYMIYFPYTFIPRCIFLTNQLSNQYQMQQQNKASAQATSLPSIPISKEWHASEIAAPDPCNSAIKRISGKQIYLKDKPQALILLQAAEIQRLTGYLNDYKCKYRSLSKEPLDRQSYEVQIKELFERDSTNKLQIERLSKTIMTITMTGEQYKKQLLSAQEKYKVLANDRDALGQRSLNLQRQLQTTRQNFDKYIKKSQAQAYSLNNQLTSQKTYTESVLKNNAELVARVNTISTYERRIFELETQIAFYIEQSQRLNRDIETKTEKLINQERGYSTLFERHKNLQNNHQDLKNQLTSHAKELQKSKLVISQLQGQSQKVKTLHDANVRESTMAISKRNGDIDALSKQVMDYNLRWTVNQKLIDDLQRSVTLQESKNAVSLQEQAKLSETIKQLQQRLNKSQTEITSLQQLHASRQLQWQSAIQKQKQTLQTDFNIKLKDISTKNDKQIANYSDILSKRQKQIEQILKNSHELQRALHASKGQLKISQQIIKTQQTEIEKLYKQEEQLKSTIIQKNSLTRALKEKNSAISQLEKTLKQQRQKQAELTAKNSKLNDAHEDLKKKYTEENISLNKMINNKVTQSQSLKRQLINNENELRIQFQSNLDAQNKSHADKIAKVHEQKQAIIDAHVGLKADHDVLKSKHAQVAQVKEELEKNHVQLNSEYEKIQATNTSLEKSIRLSTQHIAQLTNVQQLLKKQIQQKAKRIEELQKQLKSYELSLQKSQNDIQKQKEELNTLRANKIKFNMERSCYDIEIYELKEELTKLKSNITKMTEQIALKDAQIAKLKEQREQLSMMFQNKTKENESLKRKMIELQAELRDSFDSALKEKEDNHKKAYELISQEKEGLTKKIIQIEPHVTIASELKKQKQSIENTLKTTSANHEIEKTRSSNLTQENEQLRKAIIDTQSRLKGYYQDELALKSKHSQQEIDNISKELDQIKRQRDQLKTERDLLFTTSTECQARINLLMQEIQRLHSILSNNIAQNKVDIELVRTTNAALQSQVTTLSEQLQASHKREEELTTKYTILTKRITSYDGALEDIRSQLIAIQLMTGQLRQQRDLLIKKNTILIKSIRALSDELDSLQKEGDSIATFFTKESSIHKELTARFMTVQDLLNRLESSKIIIEEKTIEIASK